MEAEINYQIVPFGQFRFAIADQDGTVVDNAQGYGYKTKQKAFLAKNWKFSGGKVKAQLRKKQFNDWLKADPDHRKIVHEFNDQLEWNVKELSRGEVVIADIWKLIEREHSTTIPDYVRKEI